MELNEQQIFEIQKTLNEMLAELENRKNLMLYELNMLEQKIKKIQEFLKIFKKEE